jgi:pyrroloquinoline quinone (PQQ) biosynthesis protein C
MRVHLKQYTEPIHVLLEHFRSVLAEHPLLVAARNGWLDTLTLHELAYYQYSDSITWIPMLAQMKGKALKSGRLRKAIEDNIGHEAGLGGTSHVTLAVSLMRSLGIDRVDGFPTTTLTKEANEWLSAEFAAATEPRIAGWLLTAESLVPLMFATVKPCYDKIAGCDTTYFSEHVAVDADEHAEWMAEAVDEVVELYGPRCVPDVIAGMTIAWHETLDAPDALWSRLTHRRAVG